MDQQLKEFLDKHVTDKNLVRASLSLVALVILIPGVFQLGPPKWFGEHPAHTQTSSPANPPVNPPVNPQVNVAVTAPSDPVVKPVIEPLPDTEPGAEQGAEQDLGSKTDDVSAPQDSTEIAALQTPDDGYHSSDGGAASNGSGINDAPAETGETSTSAPEPAQEEPAVRGDNPAAAKTATDAKGEIAPETQRGTKAEDQANVDTETSADTTTASPAKAQPITAFDDVIDTTNTPILVARTFAKTVPRSQADMAVAEQKRLFISTVLPLILASNEEIRQRRMAIERATKNNDRGALEKWATLYRLKSGDLSNEALSEKILHRADEIPVPLALAQAAVESGWGTSRFARQGNALFGQWAWNKSQGLKPLEASNDRAVVRSFPNLFGSVRAYMHNLNTHARYTDFRETRARLANDSGTAKTLRLTEHLDGYAETGYDYVVKLRDIMRSNNFHKYANAYLR